MNKISKALISVSDKTNLETLLTILKKYNIEIISTGGTFKFIKDKGFVTKKNILDYLGWGVRIKFSPYRNALRKYKEIKFTKYGYEWIGE